MSETEVSGSASAAAQDEADPATDATPDGEQVASDGSEPAVSDTLVEGPHGDRPAAEDRALDQEEHRDPEPSDLESVEEPVEPTWVRVDVRDDGDQAISVAVDAIRAGQCVVVPTDTVYGIAADPFDEEAIKGLLAAKHRGREVPVAVLISDAAMVGSFVQYVDGEAEKLAEHWWPGPLTMIFRAQDSLPMDLGLTRGTIGVRVPDHEFTRRLLRRTGPLAVSSANVHGRPAATTVDEAIDQLGNDVAVYLDAGESPAGEASTIVDFSANTLGEMVREGAVSLDQLREVSDYIAWHDPAEDEDEPEVQAESEGTDGDAQDGESQDQDQDENQAAEPESKVHESGTPAGEGEPEAEQNAPSEADADDSGDADEPAAESDA